MEAAANDGAYVLRDLMRNAPLSPDGEDEHNVYITCVDAWDGNLYIGTSAGEILHFVSIPSPDSDQPTYILASRLQPEHSNKHNDALPVVEQILLLPSVGKACVLCHGTLTFYTLPELSPAFGGKIKQSDCTWVGGLDRDLDGQELDPSDGCIIVICLRQKLRVIRIMEQGSPRKIRDIDLGNCLDIQRRADLACVADGTSYALLDIVNQRKIDLFPISSSPDLPSGRSSPDVAPPRIQRPASRSVSATSPIRRPDLRNQDRIASVGGAPQTPGRQTPDRLHPNDTLSPWPHRAASRQALSPSPTRPLASPSLDTDGKVLPPTPQFEQPPPPPPRATASLKPHISTPTPNEFLLTTGTSPDDPAVGMFVNLDGDVVRGTIQFESYPESIVVDGQASDPSLPSMPGDMSQEGYVLAVVRREKNGIVEKLVEYQRWDVDPSDNQYHKDYVNLPDPDTSKTHMALREATTATNLSLPSVGKALSLRRLYLHQPSTEETESDVKRNNDEDKLIDRFSNVQSKVLLFSSDAIWWMVRNPLVVQLEARLSAAVNTSANSFTVQRTQVQAVINSIRGREATNEFEFLGFNYIRQQASLLLLVDLILKTNEGVIAFEHDKRSTHDALVEGEIDPRIILSIIPALSNEVIEGTQGLWIPGGLKDAVVKFKAQYHADSINQDPQGPYGDNLLQVIKHYLFSWRRKKGFGSIADEKQVFHTVDAALLSLLLMLDSNTFPGPAAAGSLRAELNDVVDQGVECFDRAVELLEQHKRLYVLSRLYQSRRMVGQVLSTWRRILESSEDVGGELIDGELDVRRYVTRIKDVELVKDYGTWLAYRNPSLGVQIFADENARVKFTPTEAVELLKERAPAAVKDYLEHLVFGKNQNQYANDLIYFYLDTVTEAIDNESTSAKDILLTSYHTYRALLPPKPTYSQFILDNSLPDTWWQNRLRLLQLIGGSSVYDVEAISNRLDAYSSVLVPEMIVLAARRDEHQKALKLLVHGLADFDTAVRYCLLGGSSIFHPASASSTPIATPSKEEQEVLFSHLIHCYLDLDDEEQRLERVAELLERFGSWFDVAEVLPLLSPSWPLDHFGSFIASAMGRLVSERNETVIVRALAGSQNLRYAVDVVEKIEKEGATWESVKKDSGVA
ncbi:hypothetical protein D6C78_03573 [Aureobasidium pullulans]|uniref:CNH domain-containing protein n=1 Tax=Aureobasidium pullulans TaxID=5580 RepID=A0A4T0BVQ6_AURPU|nr:hypothetical protein D6C78_03573 [Aureobasidium pullulans]